MKLCEICAELRCIRQFICKVIKFTDIEISIRQIFEDTPSYWFRYETGSDRVNSGGRLEFSFERFPTMITDGNLGSI